MEGPEVIADALSRINRILHRSLDGQSAETLCRLPAPHANSMAWLAWHLTRIQDHHVSDLVGLPQLWSSEWHERFSMAADDTNTGSGHTAEQVAALQVDSADPLLGYADAVYERARTYLSGNQLGNAGRGHQRAPVRSAAHGGGASGERHRGQHAARRTDCVPAWASSPGRERRRGPARMTMRVPRLSLDSFSLRGKVAIVTGGSDGIGRGIAHGFVDAGAQVVIAARRPEKIDDVAAEIEAKGGEVLGVPTDATDPDAVQAMVDAALERFGKVDVLANIVGGSQGPTFRRGPLLELDKDDFMEAFNINVASMFLCSKAVVPHMLARETGSIINMASIGAREYRLPETGMSVYNMTKAAVMHLTRSMAKEWAPHVRVNCINAGHVLTPRRVANESQERHDRSLAEIEIGRFGEPEDIAAAAVYLASDAGSFVNGAFLDVHGGT